VSEVLGHKEIAITLDRYSHALPTMQATAMARLDAILGRGDDAAPRSAADKGSNKGSPAPDETNEEPDPSVDRARNGEFGTAYRMLVGFSHAAHDAHVRLPGDTWAAWVGTDKGSDKGSASERPRGVTLVETTSTPWVYGRWTSCWAACPVGCSPGSRCRRL
jgi:hypothetical protein